LTVFASIYWRIVFRRANSNSKGEMVEAVISDDRDLPEIPDRQAHEKRLGISGMSNGDFPQSAQGVVRSRVPLYLR
jgi:hypothetical protein